MKSLITEDDVIQRPICTLFRTLEVEHRLTWLSSEGNRRSLAEEYVDTMTTLDIDFPCNRELRICAIEGWILFLGTMAFVDVRAQFALIDAVCYTYPPVSSMLFHQIRTYFYPEIERITPGGIDESTKLYHLMRNGDAVVKP